MMKEGQFEVVLEVGMVSDRGMGYDDGGAVSGGVGSKKGE